VPPGTLVLISTWALHRDPALWTHADQFRPQRFVDGEVGPRWSYLPFGAGARQCIGKDFALVEAVLVLAVVAQHVHFSRPVDAPPPRVDALVTLRPRGGLPLVARRRRPPAT
jgi:cytochrome P450